MWVCPNCETENDEEVKVCPICNSDESGLEHEYDVEDDPNGY